MLTYLTLSRIYLYQITPCSLTWNKSNMVNVFVQSQTFFLLVTFLTWFHKILNITLNIYSLFVTFLSWLHKIFSICNFLSQVLQIDSLKTFALCSVHTLYLTIGKYSFQHSKLWEENMGICIPWITLWQFTNESISYSQIPLSLNEFILLPQNMCSLLISTDRNS